MDMRSELRSIAKESWNDLLETERQSVLDGNTERAVVVRHEGPLKALVIQITFHLNSGLPAFQVKIIQNGFIEDILDSSI